MVAGDGGVLAFVGRRRHNKPLLADWLLHAHVTVTMETRRGIGAHGVDAASVIHAGHLCGVERLGGPSSAATVGKETAARALRPALS